uniref:Putative sulfotransferase domain contining protein n=1 Tax=viral metagenome TaxID=1070528 RepID=A0A6M3KYC0_9ZZZZ
MNLALFGMFRSGTNFLWWVLSQDPQFKHSYTEPLHPLLLQDIEKYKHYHSFKDLPQLERYFSSDFAINNYSLRANEPYPELERYLSYLLQENNTLIKINRMSLRTGWFVYNFPHVACIGIIRDPRAVSYSHLVHDINGPWDPIFFDYCMQHKDYRKYLLPLQDALPYVKIIALWRLYAEHMDRLVNTKAMAPVIKLEYLSSNPLEAVATIYRHISHKGIPDEVIKAVKEPSEDAFFWGKGGKKLYEEVPAFMWKEAIKLTGAQEMMEVFGYEM